MKSSLLVLSVVLTLLAAQSPQQPRPDYSGKLNAGLLPNTRFDMSIRFDPASDADRGRLPVKAGPADKVFARKVKWPPEVGKPLAMLLVEPAQGSPYLYADVDLDGQFSAGERFAFPAFEQGPGPADDLVLRLPFGFSGSIFESYPVTLRPSKTEGTAREIFYSNKAFATGVVELDGKRVLVRYGVDAKTGEAGVELEGLGVDTNGDGRIDSEPNSPETDYGNRGAAIFRVGTHYISTQAVDSKTGRIVIRAHAPSEYERIELTTGATIPDFSFVDFEGKARKLSDYRGKYVLLDFWGTWCPPCVAEVPALKQLYGKFRSRNFEIIGMDNEAGWDGADAEEMSKAVAKAKSFAAEQAMNWTLARADSIDLLVRNRFRVRSYPMKLLLDPQGRLLSLVNDGGYRELSAMLEKTLPSGATR